MLAENTGIDARTRWREAVQLLQDDVRYTDVEDGPEREDLFNLVNRKANVSYYAVLYRTVKYRTVQ